MSCGETERRGTENAEQKLKELVLPVENTGPQRTRKTGHYNSKRKERGHDVSCPCKRRRTAG
jgi:hypothetical protein